MEALRANLNQLRTRDAELARQYASISESCRQADRRRELATAALNAIEIRLDLLETIRHLSNRTAETLAAMSQLANEIRRVAADCQDQKRSLDRGLADASRMRELLVGCDARATAMTEHGVGEAAGQVERLVTQAMADVDRRFDVFEGQKRLIAQTVAEAGRATEVMSSLEQVAALMGQRMERPGNAAGPAEQRVGTAAREAVFAIENSFRHLAAQLQILTESARNRVRERFVSVTAWRRSHKPTPMLRWTAGLSALAVMGLLGTAGILARQRSAQSVGAARLVRQDTGSAALPSELTSSASGSASFARSTDNPGPPRSTEATTTSDTGPMTHHDSTLANVAPRSERSDSPVSQRIVQPVDASATNAGPQFKGTLLIESVPSRAAVFVNQQRIGETPLQLDRLRAGSQVVWLERNGYERWSTSVIVAADRQTRLSVKLQPLRDR